MLLQFAGPFCCARANPYGLPSGPITLTRRAMCLLGGTGLGHDTARQRRFASPAVHLNAYVGRHSTCCGRDSEATWRTG